MFTSVNARMASTYKRVNAETGVNGADPHYLIEMLYTGLLQALLDAQGSIKRRDIPAKGQAIGKAVRILEEGLKGALNRVEGGEVAERLSALYDYCVMRLTQANLRSDAAMVEEVIRLMTPVADAWKQIKGQTMVSPPSSPYAGVQ